MRFTRGWRWATVGAVALVAASAMSAAWGGTAARTGTAQPFADGGGYAGRGFADSSGVRPAAVHAAVPAGNPLGIDVSDNDYQNNNAPNWPVEAANGLSFAYVKASEGTSYLNPRFDSDYHAIKANGMYAGAYAFGRPDKGDPVGQADYFVDHMEWATDGKTLPPFLDVEWPWKDRYGNYVAPYPCYGLSTGAMVNWIRGFLTEVQARIGRTPMIYTNVNWWSPCTGNDSSFGGYGLDVASCNSTPPVPAAGWSTWTYWQYAIPDCHTSSRDEDVFNGTKADLAKLAGASANLAGTASRVGSAPSAVTYRYAGAVNTAVFARDPAGGVYEDYYAGQGWQGASLGNSGVTGEPAALSNVDGSVDVFADAGGTLQEDYWVSGHPWSGWFPLGTSASDLPPGGAIAGTPSAIQLTDGSVNVYARTVNGHVAEKFYTGGTGWSSWIDLGGNTGTDPTALSNVDGSVDVFANAGGTLQEDYWVSGRGWSGWIPLNRGTGDTPPGGSLGGQPAVVQLGDRSVNVYARTANGHVAEKYYTGGTGWSSWIDLGGSISGDPAVLANADRSVDVFVHAAGGGLWEKYWTAQAGWTSNWLSRGAPAGGDVLRSPALVQQPTDQSVDVFAAASADGSLSETYYYRGTWSAWRAIGQPVT